MRTRLFATSLCLVAGLSAATPAEAQYGGRRGSSNRATGETYHVELAGTIWNPTPEIVISSESLGILGDNVDFVNTLGLPKSKFKQLKLVLRPGTKHKFRIEYTPIKYNGQNTVSTSFIFNGIRYPVGLPVTSELLWKAYRFGYEFDFVYRDRGFVGLLLETKYTDITATLTATFLGVSQTEFTHPVDRHHRPRLHRPEHLDHRRVQRVPRDRHDRRQQVWREVLRLRSLRHGELHRQPRRPGGLPFVGRVVQSQERLGHDEAQGPVLRRRRAILIRGAWPLGLPYTLSRC
jgi:hypothetical protein